MTFGQLKSSYFEECDGVHNSKLWIVEIWRLDSWKVRTLRNAMVYITLNCGLFRYDVIRINRWFIQINEIKFNRILRLHVTSMKSIEVNASLNYKTKWNLKVIYLHILTRIFTYFFLQKYHLILLIYESYRLVTLLIPKSSLLNNNIPIDNCVK